MEMLTSSLEALTTNAADYETLEFFWTLRRLTKKGGKVCNPAAFSM